MTYRDDRDVLRGKVERLEKELGEAQSELERTEDARVRTARLEKELADAQRELDEIKRKLGGHERGRGDGTEVTPASIATVIAALAVLGIGGAYFLSSRRAGPPAPPPRPAPTSAPEVEVPVIEEADPALVPAPLASKRQLAVTWQAKVTRAQGVPLEAGAACTVGATVGSDGKSSSAELVEVRCGPRTVYRSTDPMSGTSMSSTFVEELPDEREGAYRYALSHEDTGARTGLRAQASISTLAGVGAVWSDSMPSFRVELALDETSAPSEGEPLVASHATVKDVLRRPIERPGRVTAVSGQAPAKQGATCTARVRGSLGADATNCRVVIRCGGSIVYGEGSYGFTRCEGAGGAITAKDTDPRAAGGDPRLDLDLGRGRAVISDEGYAMTVTLDAEREPGRGPDVPPARAP